MTNLHGLALTVFALSLTTGCLEGGRIHPKQKPRRPGEDLQPDVWWTEPDLCGISKYPNAGERTRETNDPQSTIYGGMEAYPGEFPWTVALLNQGVLDCGAILIDQFWVLTAAHCVEYQDELFDQYSVSLGEHDTQDLNSPSRVTMEIAFTDIHIHPFYSGHFNDIALLKMPQAVSFTEDIQSACPPNVTRNITGMTCIISGWGITGDTLPKAAILQFARVPVIGHQQCSEMYGSEPVNETMHLCAGYAEGGIDSCTGDSGGPLACKFGDQFEVHGIVSWGIGCADANYPGVYTKVVSYLDWMQQVIDLNT